MGWAKTPDRTGPARGDGTRPKQGKEELVANHKQAEKRNRQRIKRRSRNLRHLSSMRTYMKRVRRALAGGQVEEAKQALPEAITAIGRAASKGVVHRNTAARYISRLTRAMNAATAGSTG
jgi:small subunit ribosomal protein S20